MIDALVGGHRILRELGRGRAGIVYLGEDPTQAGQAAIKVVEPAADGESRLRVERFLGAAQTASALRHPGIVNVRCSGFSSTGHGYLVMEHLRGPTLRQRLQAGGAFELAAALQVGRAVASTLGIAHERRIVHGRLRPENLFLPEDGAPGTAGGAALKVTDFGLGRLLTGPASGAPEELAYLSPERCRGVDRPDLNDDVYALGCILYELVCGRPPFPYRDPEAVVAAHLGEPPQPPRELAPALPPALERLILSMLSKSPAARPASLRQVEEGLARIASGAPDPAGEDGWPATRREASTPRLTPLGHVHLRERVERAVAEGVGPSRSQAPPRRTPLGQAHLHLRSLVVDDRPSATAAAEAAAAAHAAAQAGPPASEAVPAPPRRGASRWWLPAVLALAALAVGAAVVLRH